MKVITLGFKEDGKTVLLAGAEKAPSEQRKLVDGYRSNGLPDGLVRVEIWERNKIKVAVRPSAPVEAVAESEEAPQEDGEQKPPETAKAKGVKKAPKQSSEAEGDAFA